MKKKSAEACTSLRGGKIVDGLCIKASLLFLFKRSRIESHEWQNLEYLILKFKSMRWNWSEKWKIRVFPVKKDSVEQILLEKLYNSKHYEASQ